MDELKYGGEWWVDGSPMRKVAGELTIRPGSMPHLDLNRASFPDHETNEGVTLRSIHGISAGDYISLWRCSRNNYHRSYGEFGRSIRSEYVAQFATIGYPFHCQIVALDKLNIQFSGLKHWFNVGALEFDMDMDDPPHWSAGDSISFEYTQPEPLEARIDDVTISVNAAPKQQFEMGDEASLSINPRFSIDQRRPKVPFSEYYALMQQIQNFVSFAAGGSVAKEKVSGSINGTDVEIFLAKKVETNIESHPYRMLFLLPDIAADFDEVLTNWLTLSDEYQDIINLYTGVAYNPNMYPWNELQNYVHALESYHREKWGTEYMHPWMFSYFLDDIREVLKGDPSEVYPGGTHSLEEKYDIPDSMIDSLSGGRLKYSNEYSLKKRLDEIVDYQRSILTDLPYSIIGKERLTTDTRNYFAHYTDELERRAATGGPELQELVWSVQQLVEVCLLDELGIPERHIEKRLTNKYDNKFTRNL